MSSRGSAPRAFKHRLPLVSAMPSAIPGVMASAVADGRADAAARLPALEVPASVFVIAIAGAIEACGAFASALCTPLTQRRDVFALLACGDMEAKEIRLATVTALLNAGARQVRDTLEPELRTRDDLARWVEALPRASLLVCVGPRAATLIAPSFCVSIGARHAALATPSDLWLGQPSNAAALALAATFATREST